MKNKPTTKCSKSSRCVLLAQVLSDGAAMLKAKKGKGSAIHEPLFMGSCLEPYPPVYSRDGYRSEDGKLVKAQSYIFSFCPFCGARATYESKGT
jgi:hypothetical protein